VIGATNRIDSIDPALRRPGRFDREFFFPLPTEAARKKIIDLATEKWTPKLSNSFKNELSIMTRGYNGADVKVIIIMFKF
jgi:SpoVK/Ycf46/Vps4 family AAA+-type ATPase